MNDEKKPRKLTEFIILTANAGDTDTLKVQPGSYRAGTGGEAARKFLEGKSHDLVQNVIVVAVPSRSWRPMTFEVEVQKKVKIRPHGQAGSQVERRESRPLPPDPPLAETSGSSTQLED
jgi:hypothetical protein